MGLDQFAFAKKGKEKTELASWRKHNALQGWMENLWHERGCPSKNKNNGSFNCIDLQLNAKHLDLLEKDVLENNLPETGGFFFGEDSRFDEYKKKITLKFISDSRESIKAGYKVFYSSWW
jgi:hypothetical protein